MFCNLYCIAKGIENVERIALAYIPIHKSKYISIEIIFSKQLTLL